MRYLKQFQTFDLKSFLEGKDLIFVDAQDWEEKIKDENGKETGESELMGTRLSLMISKDRTEYTNPKMSGNRVQTNSKEKFNVKSRRPLSDFDAWQEDDSVMIDLDNYEKATVWGDYSNGLTVIGEVINLDRPEQNKKSDSLNPKENH